MPSVEERLTRLEQRLEGRKWWRDHGWWAVFIAAAALLFSVVWQTEAWKVFWPDEAPVKRVGSVKLIEGHAAAFARNQWNADLRVVNGTSRDIVVERVKVIFGA